MPLLEIMLRLVILMPKGYGLTEKEKKEIEQLWEGGLTKRGIATALGVNVNCIRIYLQKHGLTDR